MYQRWRSIGGWRKASVFPLGCYEPGAIKAVNGVGNTCPAAGQNRYEPSPRDTARSAVALTVSSLVLVPRVPPVPPCAAFKRCIHLRLPAEQRVCASACRAASLLVSCLGIASLAASFLCGLCPQLLLLLLLLLLLRRRPRRLLPLGGERVAWLGPPSERYPSSRSPSSPSSPSSSPRRSARYRRHARVHNGREC